MAEMTKNEFEKFRSLIQEEMGIKIAEHKKQLIQSRLQKVLRDMNISAFDDLYDYLIKNRNSEYYSSFIHQVTTHKTDFFREYNHFQYIVEELKMILKYNPRILINKEIRVWSAGCSTGEEPYTLAMILKECLPDDISIKILATDISNEVIAQALTGIYKTDEEELNNYYRNKYFDRVKEGYKIRDEIRDLVTFRTFNLMKEFPFKNKFDIIFCRNVMIYFDLPVQERLIKKFYNAIVRGGLFFIGHSESLANKQNKFMYLKPTIYLKSD